MANDALRYIAWPSPNAASGGIIDMKHLDALKSGPYPFGLKFDDRVCPELLDYIDAELGIDAASHA